MKKRLLSLFMSAAMIFTMMPAVHVHAAESAGSLNLTVSEVNGVTEILPDEDLELCYTISMGAVNELAGVEFRVVIPEGLEVVSTENLVAITYTTVDVPGMGPMEVAINPLKANAVSWQDLFFQAYGLDKYTQNNKTDIVKIFCKATEPGDYKISFANPEFVTYSDFDNPTAENQQKFDVDVNADSLHVHNIAHVEGSSAGCETEGTKAHYSCDLCDKNYSDESAEDELSEEVVIPSLGHDPKSEYDEAKHTSVCNRCKKTLSSEAHGNWSYTWIANSKTHTVKCGSCDYSYTVECTGDMVSNGSDGHHMKCEYCKHEFGDKGHGYDDSDWTPNTDGNTHSRTCEACGYVDTAGHTGGILADKGDGSHSKICSACEAEYAVAEHVPGSEITSSDNTNHYFKCECGANVAAAHVYKNEAADAKYLKKYATCTEPALYYKSCVCGKASNTETFKYGNVLGHEAVEDWTVDSEKGTHYHKCIRDCGERLDESTHYAAEGAKYSANGVQHWSVCADCEAAFGHVDHTAAGTFYPDGDQHYQNCSVCSNKVDSSVSAHNMEQKTNAIHHWNECKDCGQQSARILHTAKDDQWFADENGHWQLCECGEKVNTAEHNDAIITNNNNGTHAVSCSVCKHVVNAAATCTPAEGKGNYNETQHWGICACGATVNAVDHIYKYSDNDDNTHKVYCDCGYVKNAKASHNTTDVDYSKEGNNHWKVCVDCEGKADVTAHSAKDSKWYFDENGHWQLCECGEKVDSSSHSDFSYSPAENDQHTVKCGVCEYEKTEPCDVTKVNWSSDGSGHWKVCPNCGDETEKDIHIPATGWSKDDSNHWHECEDCSYDVDKVGHTYDQQTKDYPADNSTDCQTPAKFYKTCQCGAVSKTETWDSDKGNHKLELVSEVKATCTEDGNIAYYKCTVDDCGKYFSDAEGKEEVQLDSTVIPATGHKMTETPAKAPTCEEAGTEGYFTCSTSCGKVYVDEAGTTETTVKARAIPKLGHKFDDDTVKGPTTLKAAATCKAPAEFWYTCSNENCDEISTEDYYTVGTVAPHSTENTKKTEAKAETCTVDGIVAHWDCTHCGTIFADNDGALGEEITEADTVIKAHGHTEAASWSADDETHWKVCACEKGCSDKCGVMIESTEAAHDWVKQDSSTETRNDFKCSVCEATKSEDITVEKPSAPSVDRDDRDDDEDDDRISSSDVKDAFEDAKGDKVTIKLGDDEEISKRVFTELQKDPDMTVVLKGDGYSWTFDGSDVDGNIKSAYFDASVRNSTPKAKAIKKLTGNADIQHVRLGHTGDLPGMATLTVTVDKDLRSEPINVYFYNAETKTLELVASGLTAKNGKVSFTLTEGGDYILTNDTFGTVADKVNPETGALDLSAVAFAVVAMAGCAAVGFKKK